MGWTWGLVAFEWLSGGFRLVANGFRGARWRDKSFACLTEMGSLVQIHFFLPQTEQVAGAFARCTLRLALDSQMTAAAALSACQSAVTALSMSACSVAFAGRIRGRRLCKD